MRLLAFFATAVCAAAASGGTPATGSPATGPALRGLPAPVVPEPFGVNIHFVRPNEAEVDTLAAVGYRFVRMDFVWSATERRKGEYNFADYDLLVDAMQRRGIRLLFILDYENRLYDEGKSPYTDEGRAAFARWAAAAARHYAGRGIIWEIWNEPNIFFWKPKPNVEDYCKLAHAVIDAVRAADPQAFIVAPASSGFPWDFFHVMAERGVLARLDAVSVHPYRQTAPETVAADYHRLRILLRRAVPGRELPVISGEWGYSTVWGRMNEQKQAQYIARQWLTNLSHDVHLSIWYDWKDDGDNPKDPEHHFGSVYRNLKDKPAAVAARALCRTLEGYRYVRRIATADPDDYLLLFSAPQKPPALAVWTAASPHVANIPTGYEIRRAVRWDGSDGASIVDNNRRTIALDNWPACITIAGPLAERLAWWQPEGSATVIPAGENGHVKVLAVPGHRPPAAGGFRIDAGGRPLGNAVPLPARFAEQGKMYIPLRLNDRSKSAIPATIRFADNSGKEDDPWQSARVFILVPNTLTAEVLPPVGGVLTVLMDNPSGQEIRGTLRATAAGRTASTALAIPAGTTHPVVTVEIAGVPDDAEVRVDGVDEAGAALVSAGPLRWRTLAFAAGDVPKVRVEGDVKVVGLASARTAEAPAGLPQARITTAVRIDYRFGNGWRYALLAPPAALEDKDIEGKPQRLGMWVFGDNSGNHLRCRFRDATGQVFQPTYGRLNWTGWRWITMPLTGEEAGHWGGANDGVVHYPVRLDSLVVIDNAKVKTDVDCSVCLAGCAVGY